MSKKNKSRRQNRNKSVRAKQIDLAVQEFLRRPNYLELLQQPHSGFIDQAAVNIGLPPGLVGAEAFVKLMILSGQVVLPYKNDPDE